MGWASVTPTQDERRGATVCVPSRDPAGLNAELGKRDIVTSFRDKNLRAMFHFYNDDRDVDARLSAMRQLRDRFAPD